MKKFKIIIVTILLLTLVSLPVLAKSNILVVMNGKKTEVREVPVVLDGKAIYSDVPTFIHKGSTLVPLRFIAEFYGAEVGWDNKTKSAMIAHNGNNITMTIDKNTVKVNDKTKTIDNNATAKLVNTGGKNSNTMVPLRFISETFGYEVGYDEEKKVPYINSDLEEIIEGIKDISLIKGSTDMSKLQVSSSKAMDISHSKDGNNINIIIKDIALEDKDLLNKDLNGKGIASVKVSEIDNSVNIKVALEAGYEYDLVQNSDKKEFILSPVDRINSIRKENGSIIISRNKGSKINQSKLDNPRRYIFDIMDSSLGTDYEEYNIAFNGILNVRASQFSPEGDYNSKDRIVRVVIDGEDDSKIDIKETEKEIIITPIVKEAEGVEKIIKYKQADNLSTIDIKLKKKSNYIFNYDDNKRIAIVLPKNNIEETKGRININDRMVEDIIVSESGIDVLVEINLKEPLKATDINKGNGSSIKIELEGEKESVKNPSGKLIVIDPGHGGSASGAVKNGIKEKDLVLEISKKVDRLLKDKGYNTYMIRETDRDINNKSRALKANELDADLYVSIHANSHSGSSAEGIEVLHNGNAKSKALASSLQKELIKETGAVDRNIKYRPNLTVLKYSDMPSSLVEVGFISNSQEASKLKTEAYQDKLVKGIVNGIENFFLIYK